MEVSMVDRAELFRIADEIQAGGRVPSHRLIRERLAGSFSDIGPLFTAWCVDRRVRPRPTKDDLPKPLGDRLATVAAAIWCDGLFEGSKAAHDERDRLAAERDALRSQLNEALATLDALERQVGLLEEDRAERSARQRRRAEEFWDRVMLEIVEIVGDDEMHVAKIVERLSAPTRREAAAFADGIEPGRIADKMRTRVAHGKYFLESGKDTFRCRITPAEPARRAPLPGEPQAAAEPSKEVGSKPREAGRGPEPGAPAPSLRDLAKRTAAIQERPASPDEAA